MNTQYTKALSWLNGRDKKKLDNNTYGYKRDGRVDVELHDTVIFSVAVGGTVTLNTGGWRTSTTKSRLNDLLRKIGHKHSIYTDKGVWYIQEDAFADGMTISPSGELRGTGDTKRQKQMVGQINRYVAGYVKALKEGQVKSPGPGDCWFCCGMGDSNDHLLLHMKERYYVPRLLYNAIEEEDKLLRARKGGWYSGSVSHWLKSAVQQCWQAADAGGVPPESVTRGRFLSTQVGNILKRYLKRRFGLGSK